MFVSPCFAVDACWLFGIENSILEPEAWGGPPKPPPLVPTATTAGGWEYPDTIFRWPPA